MPPRYIRKNPNYVQKVDNFPKFCKIIQSLYSREYKKAITHDEIMFIVENTFNQIRNIVKEGDKINFRSFGTFSRRRKKGMSYTSPTGVKHLIPETDRVFFKPSVNFKLDVKEYEIRKENEVGLVDLDLPDYKEEE